MTKNDLIRAVAQKTGFTQKETQNLIETTLSEIQDALGIGHRVEVRGFGIWEVKLGKARIGRNPSNPDADPIQIPARPVLRFKIGKDLKSAIRPDGKNAT